MDCEDIQKTLSAGGTPGGPALREHLAACHVCRELLADGGQLAHALERYRIDGSESVEDALASTKRLIGLEVGLVASLRARSTNERHIIAIAAVAAVALLTLAFARRRSWPMSSLPEFSLALVVLSLGAWFSLRAGLRGLSEPRRELRTTLIGVVCLALPFLVALGPSWLDTWGSSPHLIHRALVCFGFGAAWSLPLWLLLELLDRDQSPAAVSLLPLAAVSGISANLVLTLHCDNSDPAHALLGHAPLGVAWFGVLVGVRVLRRRFPALER